MATAGCCTRMIIAPLPCSDCATISRQPLISCLTDRCCAAAFCHAEHPNHSTCDTAGKSHGAPHLSKGHPDAMLGDENSCYELGLPRLSKQRRAADWIS